MIIIRLVGGLGNRMFLVALAKKLESQGHEVFFDDSFKNTKWSFESIALEDIFANVSLKDATPDDIKRLGGAKDFISKLRRRFSLPLLHNRHCLYLKVREGYNPALASLKGEYYINGLSITDKIFRDCPDLIRQTFAFREFTDETNAKLRDEMTSCESVAIHVRKGVDYKNTANDGVCDRDYYMRAIDYIKGHVNNPFFYIFSDNKEWVLNNFSGIPYKIIDWNPTSGPQNYLDMQLMSCARHNIIANSTYSWWGAWLNPNPGKICILPSFWFNPAMVRKTSSDMDMVPENWIPL